MKKSAITLALLGAVASNVALADCKTITAATDAGGNDLLTVAQGIVTGNPMWVTLVDETGKVCKIVNTSNGSANGKIGFSDQAWLLSRVISVQKANTSAGLSTDAAPFSTAMLYSASLPGGSLYGVQHSNPVDASRAYIGSPNTYGTNGDPLKNKRIGGVNVFGGGLGLYQDGKKVGAIGVSGDASCTDHAVAWKIREALGLSSGGGDELVIDTDSNLSPDSSEHPNCGLAAADPASGILTDI